MAICPAGPPKLSRPIRSQTRNAWARVTPWPEGRAGVLAAGMSVMIGNALGAVMRSRSYAGDGYDGRLDRRLQWAACDCMKRIQSVLFTIKGQAARDEGPPHSFQGASQS